MPSERYIMPTAEQLRQWEEEQEAKKKLIGMRHGLVHDMREAIDMATRVDPLQMNRNFPYSWQAYEATELGFKALVAAGELELAKQMAIEFMRKASYQVECSDEGQMLDEIEACLKPVVQVMLDGQSQLHRQWALDMIQADKVGVICGQALEKIARG